jgi:hypothetical protein
MACSGRDAGGVREDARGKWVTRGMKSEGEREVFVGGGVAKSRV